MERVEKTVFISYRRTNAAWALAVFQNLTQHGYDVFYDYESVPSGDFEQIILENIKARAHFLVLLTPSALKRCDEPGDWLRREIETAIDTRRNIVPLMLDRFDFDAPAVARRLTGRLAALKDYNALDVPTSYFLAAMDRLRERHLNVPLTAVLHPPSEAALQAARSQQVAALAAPQVGPDELTAQQWFERGFAALDLDEQVRCYTEAIRLKPDFADAYINRGIAHDEKGDTDAALRDYDEAIRLKPDDPDAYLNRGNAGEERGDLDGALRDYDEAIRLKPDFAEAYVNRGYVRDERLDLAGALRDYDEAIRLRSDDADAYLDRGVARAANGDFDGALRDNDEAIRLQPDNADPYYNRALAREGKGDPDGAMRDYDEAIRLRRDHAAAYFNRASLWEERARYAEAIADLGRYLAAGGGLRDGDQTAVARRIQRLEKKAGTKPRGARRRGPRGS